MPVVFAAGTTRRPLRIVAGLIVSFSAFTLFGTWLLSALGLPDDLLRDLGLAVLVVVALGLIFPALGHQLERPFARLAQNRGPSAGGGFVLGLSLGVLYVPCAGPVLADGMPPGMPDLEETLKARPAPAQPDPAHMQGMAHGKEQMHGQMMQGHRMAMRDSQDQDGASGMSHRSDGGC